jgi:hypothetical protein
LILSESDAPSLFFDLNTDPFELNNLFQDPAYKKDIDRLTQAIHAWQGQGPKSQIHVDEDAPVINQPNVPDRYDNHRKEIEEYYRQKWEEAIQGK